MSRISLFRNGEWVGDGHARELQQADGSYLHISLGAWRMAKRLADSDESQVQGKAPAELALVNDLQALSKQRTQEKKAAQRNSTRRTLRVTQEPGQQSAVTPNKMTDEETERVIRFLHG